MGKWTWKIEVNHFDKTSFHMERSPFGMIIMIRLALHEKNVWSTLWDSYLHEHSKERWRMDENLVHFMTNFESGVVEFKRFWIHLEKILGRKYPLWLYNTSRSSITQYLNTQRSHLDACWFHLNDHSCIQMELSFQEWQESIQKWGSQNGEGYISILGLSDTPDKVYPLNSKKRERIIGFIQWTLVLVSILLSGWIYYQAQKGDFTYESQDAWDVGINPLFDFLLLIHKKNEKLEQLSIQEADLPIGFNKTKEKESLHEDYKNRLIVVRNRLVQYLRTERDNCLKDSMDAVCLASIWSEEKILDAFLEGKVDSSFVDAWLSLGCDEFEAEINEIQKSLQEKIWVKWWKSEKNENHISPDTIAQLFVMRSPKMELIPIFSELQFRLPSNAMPKVLDDWARYLQFHYTSPGEHYNALQRQQAKIWTDSLEKSLSRLEDWKEEWKEKLQEYIASINQEWDIQSASIPTIDSLIKPLSKNLWTSLKESFESGIWKKKWPFQCDTIHEIIELEEFKEIAGYQGSFQKRLEYLHHQMPDSSLYFALNRDLSELQRKWWTEDGSWNKMEFSWELCPNRYAATILQIDDRTWNLSPQSDSCIHGFVNFPGSQHIRMQLIRNQKKQEWVEQGNFSLWKFLNQWGRKTGKNSIDVMLLIHFGQIQAWTHWIIKDIHNQEYLNQICISSNGEDHNGYQFSK